VKILIGIYSSSKLSTMMAPIGAGIVITIRRFSAIAGSVVNENLFKENKTSATTKAAIKYAMNILLIK
jgi:hypothetical protein